MLVLEASALAGGYIEAFFVCLGLVSASTAGCLGLDRSTQTPRPRPWLGLIVIVSFSPRSRF